jgi:hypothetical protein
MNWACANCTFLNHEFLNECEVCGTFKGSNQVPLPTQVAEDHVRQSGSSSSKRTSSAADSCSRPCKISRGSASSCSASIDPVVASGLQLDPRLRFQVPEQRLRELELRQDVHAVSCLECLSDQDLIRRQGDRAIDYVNALALVRQSVMHLDSLRAQLRPDPENLARAEDNVNQRYDELSRCSSAFQDGTALIHAALYSFCSEPEFGLFWAELYYNYPRRQTRRFVHQRLMRRLLFRGSAHRSAAPGIVGDALDLAAPAAVDEIEYMPPELAVEAEVDAGLPPVMDDFAAPPAVPELIAEDGVAPPPVMDGVEGAPVVPELIAEFVCQHGKPLVKHGCSCGRRWKCCGLEDRQRELFWTYLEINHGHCGYCQEQAELRRYPRYDQCNFYMFFFLLFV